MTSNELKELVKQHFSLTEVQDEATNEIFGEIKDVNGAFTLLFEGDVLEVGKEVKVRTTDGQELSAPDGFHELENGMMIKTEGGKVVEITEKTENETETEEDEMAEQISEVEGVEVEKMAEAEVEVEETEMEVSPMVEEVAVAVIEAVKGEIESMKKDMEEMKRKMAEIEEAPATMKTEPEVKMSKDNKTTAEPFNKARFEMVMSRAQNK